MLQMLLVDVEGVGDEVVTCLMGVAGLLVVCAAFALSRSRDREASSVHPAERSSVDSVREAMSGSTRTAAAPPRRYGSENQCPVCLNEIQYGVETNCGHVFCGSCMFAYRNHSNSLGSMRCPVCRQQITILFACFTLAELSSATPDQAQARSSLQREINVYNLRFSGEPRPLMDYVRDLPTILRHLWNEFFSVGGLVHMFRIRIVLCLLAAVAYLVSPLDIIPEAVFGILGLMDDVFVFLLLAIYVSIIYRRYLASRHSAAD